MTATMLVSALWRYPLKSARGESLSTVEVGSSGLIDDRSWAVVDADTGYVLSARREPDLLSMRLVHSDGGNDRPSLIRADGATAHDDATLSAWLHRSVRLEPADAGARSTYETVVDFEHEATADWITWQGPPGSFHDSTSTQVSIVSKSSLGRWDVRRFRPNIVVDGAVGAIEGGGASANRGVVGEGGFDEDQLVGHRVGIGSVVLDVVKQIDRCVVTTRSQPDGIGRDLDVLREINRERASFLGVGSMVVTPGIIAVGDEVIDLGPIDSARPHGTVM